MTSILDKVKKVTSILDKVNGVTSILYLSVHWSSNQLVWDVHHWLNWKEKIFLISRQINSYVLLLLTETAIMPFYVKFPAVMKRHKKRKMQKNKTTRHTIPLFAKLTLNDQGDPLADRGRDLVARDAEIRSHLFSGDVLMW